MGLVFALVGVGGLACLVFLVWFDRRNRVSVIGPWDQERELAKKKPYFRREMVEAKVKSLFPNGELAEILRLLDDNNIPSVWGRERIQLDILKVSGGDLDRLRHSIDEAKRDFMSVIRLAEYPEGSRIDVLDIGKLPYDEHRRVFGNDLRQYLDWLKKR
ncbi:MAG: hypothetical protein M3268_06665 [Acidobacteriota bacterium]|nr:hypothetical protein [Acidobacteriota bacterium]